MVPMEFWLLSFLSLLTVVTVGSNAALPAEVYWHSKLPNTPIPNDLQNLLQSDMGNNITFWDMGYKNKTFLNNVENALGEKPEIDLDENPDDGRRRYRYKRYKYGNQDDGEDLDDRRRRYKYKRYKYASENAPEEDPENASKEDSENALEEDPTDRRRRYRYKRYKYAFENDLDEDPDGRSRSWRYKSYKYASENDLKDFENALEEESDDRTRRYRYKRYKYASENDVEEDFVNASKDDPENALEEDSDDRRRRYRYKRYKYAFDDALEEDPEDRYKRYKYANENSPDEDHDDRRKRYKYKRYKYSHEHTPEETTHDRRDKPLVATVFFSYDDLHAGKKFIAHITKSSNKAKILPRQVVETIPFSTEKLPELLKQFSIEATSPQARAMKENMRDCESPGLKGEDKFCVRSLESIVNFSVKHSGANAQVLLNEVDKPTRPQEYTIMDVKYIGENHAVCHKLYYPYAVYYCHALVQTKVFNTDLVGEDGTKAKAVIICHSDTSEWDINHFAFKETNMKRGEGTICHFIRSDTFVIVSNAEIKEKISTDTNLLTVV